MRKDVMTAYWLGMGIGAVFGIVISMLISL